MTSRSGNDTHGCQLRFDTTVAHPARVYDFWLGGKDNFQADRVAGQQVAEAQPGIMFGVQANRAFLGRAVRLLARDLGIRQFLDIGTGIPTRDNTHEVAQSVAPRSRIVYVDNDRVASRVVHTSSMQMYDYYLGGCFLRLRKARRRPAQLGAVSKGIGGAGDDEVGTFPGSLAGYERVFFGQPVVVVLHGRLPAGLPDPGQAAALGFGLAGTGPRSLRRVDARVRAGRLQEVEACACPVSEFLFSLTDRAGFD